MDEYTPASSTGNITGNTTCAMTTMAYATARAASAHPLLGLRCIPLPHQLAAAI